MFLGDTKTRLEATKMPLGATQTLLGGSHQDVPCSNQDASRIFERATKTLLAAPKAGGIGATREPPQSSLQPQRGSPLAPQGKLSVAFLAVITHAQESLFEKRVREG